MEMAQAQLSTKFSEIVLIAVFLLLPHFTVTSTRTILSFVYKSLEFIINSFSVVTPESFH